MATTLKCIAAAWGKVITTQTGPLPRRVPPPRQAPAPHPSSADAMPQNVPLWIVSISRTIVIPGIPNGGTARGYQTGFTLLAAMTKFERAGGRPYVYASAPSASTSSIAAYRATG